MTKACYTKKTRIVHLLIGLCEMYSQDLTEMNSCLMQCAKTNIPTFPL